MPKYNVLLMDGRTIPVRASDEDQAKKQALHQETTRIVIATKRNQTENLMPPSVPYSVTFVKP